MKSWQLLLLAPMALWSCAPNTGLTLSCNALSGHSYTGDVKNSAGAVLDTVTLNFADNAQPGFKHNVQVVPPPPGQPLASLDGECSGNTTVTIYTPGSSPSPNTKQATWSLSDPTGPGAAFHLRDPGSNVFPSGGDGEFRQTS